MFKKIVIPAMVVALFFCLNWPGNESRVRAFSPARSLSAASCVLCHEEKGKHWPETTHGRAAAKIGMTCTSCHIVRGLHATKVTAENSVERCGQCHFASPEGAASPRQEGGMTSLLNRAAWQEHGHGKGGLSCLECHSIHQSATASTETMLKVAGKELCLRCHQAVAAHRSPKIDQEAVKTKNCTVCHDPHGGEKGIVLRELGGRAWDFQKTYKHKPVVEGRCNDCHAAHVVIFGRVSEENIEELQGQVERAGGKTALLTADRSRLCEKCHEHEPIARSLEQTPHGAIRGLGEGEEGSPCMACHLPHTSDYKALTKLEGNKLCLVCHPGYAPHHFLAMGKVRQEKLSCVSCHNPHGTGRKNLLVEDSNVLCSVKCHKK